MSGVNILVLEGSPRKNGNSEILADAFIKGAKEAGNNVTKLNVAELNIGGCKGCAACWKTQGNCVFDDDMRKVEAELEKADVLVIASPLYWSVVPAQLKAPIDRLYQYDPVHGGKKLGIKESVLLTCGETENEEDFKMIRDFYSFMVEWNGMAIKDIIAVPAVNLKGDINGNSALTRAEELGRSF